MAKVVGRRDSYRVGNGRKPIQLRVDVGLGQLGACHVTVDDATVVTAPTPVVVRKLGLGDALAGKQLVIRTLVTDISVAPNTMSVTITLRGGRAAETFTLNHNASRPGASCIFQQVISLRA
jgi:hypothetical protein